MNPSTSDLPVAQVKAELFKAMGHPARIRVLETLSEGERTVGEIASLVDLEMSTLSQQLAVLRRAGVVTTRRQGNSIHYALRDERMSQLLAVARQIIVSSLRDSREMLESLDGRP
ncbi:metalloregulator ArsR/SmtB family transcription factor [Salinibacterium sp. SYSU T00001]|uniref:ArsR/SmtB family transcription factor n=1 Tax=Homoserinimonas sedimenticola TaxID=2986805 RepID=UPI0022357035|nr:metalloregulator ArsR/SmtB family transcription factor [Salinibacterium sedimenticola]MCW4386759.1 metalloregulator ArsR/SmtB family transcription factor [Salinibacterium sedimenticola]